MFDKSVMAELQAEDRARKQSMLRLMCWTSLATTPIGLVIAPLANPSQAAEYIRAALTLLAGLGLILELARRGRVRLASWFLVLGAWQILTNAALEGRMVQGPAYWAYMVPILLAGLLLGERVGLAMAAFCCVSGLAMAAAQLRWHGLTGNAANKVMGDWCVSVVYFWLVAALQWMSMRAIGKSLTHWGRMYDEKLGKEGELKNAMGMLEKSMEAIRKSEERYRLLIDRAADGIFLADKDGTLLEANSSLARMLGRPVDSVIGKSVAEFIAPGDRGRIDPTLAALASGKAVLSEWKLLRGGAPFTAELSAGSLPEGNLQGILRDVTERKHLEEELRQSQKLEEIGKLAGGVAHDFNNLITALFGQIYFAGVSLSEGRDVAPILKEIEQVGVSGANLTRQLLAFARRQVIEPRVIDLNELCAESAKMLSRLVGEGMEISLLPHGGLWPVRVDPGQIEQVLVNLVVNARDAMPSGGKVTIETDNWTLAREGTAPALGMAPGDYVVLTVTDTGCGMDLATQKRIFEPFFTTKEPGKGTGLGLATSYGIVKQSGGSIAVRSDVGCGTMFMIYLPRCERAEGGEQQAKPLPGGDEFVLVVEDDGRVRRFAADFLRSLGYRVMHAANGEEALRIMQEGPLAPDLLLTDVVMPQMGGIELARRLRQRRPAPRILYASGFSEGEAVQGEVARGAASFLQKPYGQSELARKLREVLDSTPPRA